MRPLINMLVTEQTDDVFHLNALKIVLLSMRESKHVRQFY